MESRPTSLATAKGDLGEFAVANPRGSARQSFGVAKNPQRRTWEKGDYLLQRRKRTHREVCLRVPGCSLRIRVQGLPKREGRRLWIAAELYHAFEPAFTRRSCAERLCHARAPKARARYC
jgi:hypothetical protein